MDPASFIALIEKSVGLAFKCGDFAKSLSDIAGRCESSDLAINSLVQSLKYHGARSPGDEADSSRQTDSLQRDLRMIHKDIHWSYFLFHRTYCRKRHEVIEV